MRLEIKCRKPIKGITITDLNKNKYDYESFVMEEQWYKIVIPGTRYSVIDISVDGESIKHYLNSGSMSDDGYKIWIHGNLAKFFSRVSECIAQDDLINFKMLGQKYMICESWNEPLQQDFVPQSVSNFFANGEGPFWYHKDDWFKLPFVEHKGDYVSTDIDLTLDLLYEDSKFYGQGKCKSLKSQPVLPTIGVDDLKSASLREAMKKFGFTDILQIQYVELEPNAVLPVHRDDWTYENGKQLVQGPSQLYFVLSGEKDDVKFKFKNVGLLDVDKPIFINNQAFIHSLVYTGKSNRGVLLAYGNRKN